MPRQLFVISPISSLGYQGRHKKNTAAFLFFVWFFLICSFAIPCLFLFVFSSNFHYQCQVSELKVAAIRTAPFFSRTPWCEVGYSIFFINDMDMKCLYRNVQACSSHTHTHAGTHAHTLDLCPCLIVVISTTVLSARVGEVGGRGDGWMGFWFIFNCGNLKTQLFVGSNRWAWHSATQCIVACCCLLIFVSPYQSSYRVISGYCLPLSGGRRREACAAFICVIPVIVIHMYTHMCAFVRTFWHLYANKYIHIYVCT